MTKSVERIEQWPLERLKPYERNARIHSDAQIAQIAESIKRFGFNNPILVDGDAGIIAGHGRLAGAWKLGLSAVPVIVLDHLSDAERRAYILADNKLAENAAWDDEMLASELAALNEEEFDLGVIGFSDRELEKMLGGDDDGRADECSDVPERAATARGDLWVLGRHRLLCGDATSREDVERLMAGVKADMVFTDPPYNVDYEGNYIQSGRILTKSEQIWSGGIANDNRDDFAAWLANAYMIIDSVADEGASLYVWHPSGAEGRHFWSAWLWDRWHFQVDLIWNKTSLIISRWDYKPQHEPCMYGWKGKNRRWSGLNNEPTIWDLPRQQGASGERRDHPTQKPVALTTRAIGNHDPHIVMDVFGGSGSTLIACEKTNRNCRMMEIAPEYCDVIVNRWQEYAGREATLEDGRTFAEVRAERLND